MSKAFNEWRMGHDCHQQIILGCHECTPNMKVAFVAGMLKAAEIAEGKYFDTDAPRQQIADAIRKAAEEVGDD